MKKNWKKLVFPGFGGILIGLAAVALGRKIGKLQVNFQPVSEWGENFDFIFSEDNRAVSLIYHCRQTPFKVWSLIGGAVENADEAQQSRVYHVQIRELGSQGEVSRESLYATIHGVMPDEKHTRAGQAALGCRVELRECRVGGAVNGVETGRRVRAAQTLQRIGERGLTTTDHRDQQTTGPES